MKRGITKCEWCLTENSNNTTRCNNCGGPVAVLEPWVLQCGWCKTSNRRDQVSHCISCGGQLPSIPGSSRQPEPPKQPRNLSFSYKIRVKYTGNALMMIGIIFMIVGLPALAISIFEIFEGLINIPFIVFSLVFPVIGFFLVKKSNKNSNQKLNALQFGVPTRGVIKKVYVDTTQSINKKHPLKIEYEFDTPLKTRHDSVRVWDRANLKRPKGEHIWVVCNPENLKENNLWPPLA
ncbi:hypothetical protein [Marixanthomonas spongiae]|uniref:Uncharacterized protein n=1 Tax=Marixanthomonas spongiae TaxID=2174845 RepID=A0A2U0I0T5_9FLAO|nr:hypothetical protein [Marixanthomonas spongiae]PVW14714.1 hypothetical protein DDV96_09365 [Marixanthomonas spongiae]